MKKIFIATLVFSTVLLLGACTSNDSGNSTEGMQVSDISLPDTYDEALAQTSYKRACENCHGADLQGAPAHAFPITEITKEEVYIDIIEGAGLMPGSMVVDEEAKNLAVWIAAQ